MEGGKDIKDRAYCLTHENGTPATNTGWMPRTHAQFSAEASTLTGQLNI